MYIVRILIITTLLSSTIAAIGQSFSIVAQPRTETDKRYVSFLQDELHKRTESTVAMHTTLADARGISLILGSAEQMPGLLGRSYQGWNKRASTLKASSDPEAFSVIPLFDKGRTALVLTAKQGRGQLFALGWFLRKAQLSSNSIDLPKTEAFLTAPEKRVRGYQIGYRMKNNTYDAWTLAQFQQQMLDMAVFGLNTMQVVAPISDDDPISPLFPAPAQDTVVGLSRMSQQYGLRYDLFYPEMAKDYTDPKQAAAELKQFEELVKSLPLVDSVHIPGGDPGHTAPEILMPLVEQETKILHRYHPKAEMWVSGQGFTAERYERFYAIMREKPSYLTGVFFGPQSRDGMDLQRKKIPAQYPIEFYPDTAHVMHSQFPVPQWDPIFALTENREPICPRPAAFEHIYKHFNTLNSGFIVYSEGVNDDVNKVLWGTWGWKTDAETHNALHDYARYFFAADPKQAEAVATVIEGLEKNWDGPLLINRQIPATLQQIESLHPRLASANWRWDSFLYRAQYDRFLQIKRGRELATENKALDALKSTSSVDQRIQSTRTVLSSTHPETEEQRLHQSLGDLAKALFQEVGLQLSVKLYGASNWERGANFDRVDTPLNNRRWIETRLQKAETSPSKNEALSEIANWKHPVPGVLYDDLGDPANQPHLVRGAGWSNDPEMYHTAIDGIADETLEKGWRLSWLSYAETLYEEPLRMHYDHLDPAHTYRIRVTYAGEEYRLPMEMKANGLTLQPFRTRSANPEQVEFSIPSSAIKDGSLSLEWNRPFGKGGGGRGGQVAEVWLIP